MFEKTSTPLYNVSFIVNIENDLLTAQKNALLGNTRKSIVQLRQIVMGIIRRRNLSNDREFQDALNQIKALINDEIELLEQMENDNPSQKFNSTRLVKNTNLQLANTQLETLDFDNIDNSVSASNKLAYARRMAKENRSSASSSPIMENTVLRCIKTDEQKNETRSSPIMKKKAVDVIDNKTNYIQRGASRREYAKPWLEKTTTNKSTFHLKKYDNKNGNDSSFSTSSMVSTPITNNNYNNHYATQSNQTVNKTYNEFVYGDKNDGSDSDLIKTLEKEHLISSNIFFKNIAGLKYAKDILEETVLLPKRLPTFFTGIRRPWKGILLYGPPGTGKTMLAKAVAAESASKFFSINPSSIASKYRGESEKMVKLLFSMAQFYSPTTIFFDEIDSIASRRGEGSEHEASRRVKCELLVQMDDLNSINNGNNVTIIGATNRPWDLDEAFLRRFEKRIYIPLPEENSRKHLLELILSDIHLNEDINISELVQLSAGYSCCDITSVCREASLMELRKKINEEKLKAYDNNTVLTEKDFDRIGKEANNSGIKRNDFLDAFKNIQTSVSADDLHRYQLWTKDFGAV